MNHGSQSKSTDEWKSGWRQRSAVVVVLVVVMIAVGVLVVVE